MKRSQTARDMHLSHFYLICDEFCTEQCVIGCQCKPGFFRNDQKVCVAKCSGSCGLSEERKLCGTACEPTCANPNPVSLALTHFFLVSEH
ncbi:hypothetical protein ANCCEY_04952 [Ancylostoma ceylanicum]|uniref:TIL domain-containing protein n=1 Tax=Ancylostoma ceylanicum TaxID=53326 RepID=A0A0D6LVS9_9BILA|nr:hypothetical protein ANCCEY_04952 [Ancylostoma ceylanicum]